MTNDKAGVNSSVSPSTSTVSIMTSSPQLSVMAKEFFPKQRLDSVDQIVSSIDDDHSSDSTQHSDELNNEMRDLVNRVSQLSSNEQCLLIKKLLPQLDRCAIALVANQSNMLSKVDFISELPNQIVLKLLDMLPVQTHLIMILVCKEWKTIIPPVWITACERAGIPLVMDDPSFSTWRLKRLNRRRKQLALVRSIEYSDEADDMIVRAIGTQLRVAHPFFAVHIIAPNDFTSLRGGFILLKPNVQSMTLTINSDCADGSSTYFIHTGIMGGPSSVMPLDDSHIIMSFPDGSIQYWAWRRQLLVAQCQAVAQPMGRCIDYAPAWDMVAVGGNDGSISLVRLHQGICMIVYHDPETIACPVINIRIMSLCDKKSQEHGVFKIRSFLAVSHQMEFRPILNQTTACTFACVNVYEIKSDPQGRLFFESRLRMRSEPYSIGVKPSIQLNKSVSRFCWVTVDYSEADMYIGDRSHRIHIHEFDPSESLLTTGIAEFNSSVSNTTVSGQQDRFNKSYVNMYSDLRTTPSRSTPTTNESGFHSPLFPTIVDDIETLSLQKDRQNNLANRTTAKSYIVRNTDSPLNSAFKAELTAREISTSHFANQLLHAMREWTLLGIGTKYATVSLIEHYSVSNEQHSSFIIFERTPIYQRDCRSFAWQQVYAVTFKQLFQDREEFEHTSIANPMQERPTAFSAFVAGSTKWLDGLDGQADFGMVFGGLWYDFTNETWMINRFTWREIDRH